MSKKLSPFNENRILQGTVEVGERDWLARKVLQLFTQKAALENKAIVPVTDMETYVQLYHQGQLFSGEKFYVLTHEETGKIIDLNPVLFHLYDLEIVQFYSKLIQHDEYHQR